MKFCIKCGEELSDDAKFCSKCGTKQDSAAASIDKQTKPETKETSPTEKTPYGIKSLVDILSKVREMKQSAQKETSPAKKTPSQETVVKKKPSSNKKPGRKPSAQRKPWLDKVREMYELTPQEANYKKCRKNNQCGCNNCYGFAMQVAAGKMDLDECPYHE
jgi:hypothetical protein